MSEVKKSQRENVSELDWNSGNLTVFFNEFIRSHPEYSKGAAGFEYIGGKSLSTTRFNTALCCILSGSFGDEIPDSMLEYIDSVEYSEVIPQTPYRISGLYSHFDTVAELRHGPSLDHGSLLTICGKCPALVKELYHNIRKGLVLPDENWDADASLVRKFDEMVATQKVKEVALDEGEKKTVNFGGVHDVEVHKNATLQSILQSAGITVEESARALIHCMAGDCGTNLGYIVPDGQAIYLSCQIGLSSRGLQQESYGY